MTMTEQQNILADTYESPMVTVSFCELWSGLCAQSVVTDASFNEIAPEAQESGGEIDMSQETFNHTWEDITE